MKTLKKFAALVMGLVSTLLGLLIALVVSALALAYVAPFMLMISIPSLSTKKKRRKPKHEEYEEATILAEGPSN